IDDRIRALEADLEVMGSSDDSESESSNSSGSESDRGTGNPKQKKLKLQSAELESERIERLPPEMLPLPGISTKLGNKKKKKGKRGEKVDGGAKKEVGLDGAVRELLQGYKARSSERIPFYCRVCQFEGKSVEGLAVHRKGLLHQKASEKERKLSFCSLCKKQFTSPPQLKEHLKGKAHHERMQHVRERQKSSKHQWG
ncbi:unnamed protein product, partial [Chrysoparadoxa australica]